MGYPALCPGVPETLKKTKQNLSVNEICGAITQWFKCSFDMFKPSSVNQFLKNINKNISDANITLCMLIVVKCINTEIFLLAKHS